jgi:hypothetical protein
MRSRLGKVGFKTRESGLMPHCQSKADRKGPIMMHTHLFDAEGRYLGQQQILPADVWSAAGRLAAWLHDHKLESVCGIGRVVRPLDMPKGFVTTSWIVQAPMERPEIYFWGEEASPSFLRKELL